MEEKETYDSSEIICPYCDNEERYTGDPLGDDDTTEVVCSNCKKEYEVKGVIKLYHICR